MVETTTVLRSLHILFAVVWAGAGFHYSLVTRAHLRGSPARFDFLANSKHGPFMGMVSLGTVVFGLATYFSIGADAYSSGQNAVLGVGMLAGIVAAANGFVGHLPHAKRTAAALDSGEGLEALGRQDDLLDRISAISIVVALLAMVLFRWF